MINAQRCCSGQGDDGAATCSAASSGSPSTIMQAADRVGSRPHPCSRVRGYSSSAARAVLVLCPYREGGSTLFPAWNANWLSLVGESRCDPLRAWQPDGARPPLRRGLHRVSVQASAIGHGQGPASSRSSCWSIDTPRYHHAPQSVDGTSWPRLPCHRWPVFAKPAAGGGSSAPVWR